MRKHIHSNGTSFRVALKVKTKSEQPIAIVARDKNLPNNLYIKRLVKVSGEKDFDIRFPVSPKEIELFVFNKNNGNPSSERDPSFQIIDYEIKELNKCPFFVMSNDEKEWIEFANDFAKRATINSCGDANNPHIYTSRNGKYVIKYFDYLRGKGKANAGVRLNTPARIGHKSGFIEVSKQDFMKYTVPERIMILNHEWGHKYGNPKYGLDISNEAGADINGLLIHLVQGFSESEAVHVFVKVFNGADTELNRKRMPLIMRFIKDFKEGKIVTGCKLP